MYCLDKLLFGGEKFAMPSKPSPWGEGGPPTGGSDVGCDFVKQNHIAVGDKWYVFAGSANNQ
jgi:hypothetical protein